LILSDALNHNSMIEGVRCSVPPWRYPRTAPPPKHRAIQALLAIAKPAMPKAPDRSSHEFVRPKIGIISLRVGAVAEMTLSGCREGQEVLSKSGLVRSAICPKSSPSIPQRPKSFLVSDGVLDDQRLHTIRMRHCETKADRTTVILEK
jgi:hypothetical protein